MFTTLSITPQMQPGTGAPNRAGFPLNRIPRACRLPAGNRFFAKFQRPVIGSHQLSSDVIFDPAKSLPIPAICGFSMHISQQFRALDFCFIHHRSTNALAYRNTGSPKSRFVLAPDFSLSAFPLLSVLPSPSGHGHCAGLLLHIQIGTIPI